MQVTSACSETAIWHHNYVAVVVHCKKAPRGSFVYIGRPSRWGNPFNLANPRDDKARADVIEQYRDWFLLKIETDHSFRESVESLRGMDLGCWCAPRACHGDVILEWLAKN